MATLILKDNTLILSVQPLERMYVRAIGGGRFDKANWVFPFSPDKVRQIERTFPGIAINADIKEKV